MKKLEDIPKKNIFEVPDGYFDRLPTLIQNRVAVKTSRPLFGMVLKFALPAVVVIAAGIYWMNRDEKVSPENLLASVSTEQLVAYLHDSEVTEEDLLELGDFDEADADSVSIRVLDNYNDLELDALANEIENEL